MMRMIAKMTVLNVALLMVSAAQAGSTSGLQNRDLDGNLANGPEAFYDAAHNITWLRAASPNIMSWSDAKAWAEMDRYGVRGWRLPTVVDKGNDGMNWSVDGTDAGFNVDTSKAAGSEMAHLFYDLLGNKAYYDTIGEHQPDYGLKTTGSFQNLQSGYYWSGTTYAAESGSLGAWLFQMSDGGQGWTYKYASYNALAVLDGDVAAVPEPESYAMLLAGLSFLVLQGYRRRNRA
jgi:hypothetical protein